VAAERSRQPGGRERDAAAEQEGPELFESASHALLRRVLGGSKCGADRTQIALLEEAQHEGIAVTRA